MKRLFSALIIFFLVGCGPRSIPTTFTPDPDVKARAVVLFLQVNRVMTVPITPYLNGSHEVNAWTDGKNLFITVGALRHDDQTVMFILAHELAHVKLNHIGKRDSISMGVTAGMILLNTAIPGAGILNRVVNPAVQCMYSRSQELDADKEASETCKRLGIPIVKQIDILNDLRKVSSDGGGFWDQHPKWDERIDNISPKIPPR